MFEPTEFTKGTTHPSATSQVKVCTRPACAETEAQNSKLAVLAALWTGLALPEVPDTVALHAELSKEVPGLQGLIDWIAGEMRLRRALGGGVFGLPPILLHGPPGGGKTHLARRIAEVARVPSRLLVLAGSSDVRTLLGTSAGYATGAACLPAQVMAQTGCAAPVLVLDEIDKAARDTRQGCWSDALLPFLEPVSARGLFDEFLMTEIDCSRISWIATANDLSVLPKPLLNRFTCFEIPAQTCGSQAQLLAKAARSAALDFGLGGLDADCLFDPVLRAEIALPDGACLRSAKGALRTALAAQIGGAIRH